MEVRIGNAVRMFGGLSEAVLQMKELSKKTKLKVLNAIMLCALMNGCKTCSLTKQQESKVQGTQMRVLRRIEGVSKVDRVRNEDLRMGFTFSKKAGKVGEQV